MSADIIDFGERCDLKPVTQADQLNRCINSMREMFKALGSEERLIFLSQVLAIDACESAGRNACHGNAMRRAGECFALAVMAVNKSFPPPGEEPFQ